jgi:hypothetical protein
MKMPNWRSGSPNTPNHVSTDSRNERKAATRKIKSGSLGSIFTPPPQPARDAAVATLLNPQ